MDDIKPLGYLLGLPFRVFINQVAVEFRNREIELTFEQFVMLRLIHEDENIIQQDIANRLQKDKSIIVRQMNDLFEQNLVVSQTNRDDKRKKNLALTPEGIEKMNRLSDLVLDVSKKLLADVEKNDYQAFLRVLNKIQENGNLADESENL